MEKNTGVAPRNLSNRELVRYATLEWDSKNGLSIEMQRELLRRFTNLAPMDLRPERDHRQKELFTA